MAITITITIINNCWDEDDKRLCESLALVKDLHSGIVRLLAGQRSKRGSDAGIGAPHVLRRVYLP